MTKLLLCLNIVLQVTVIFGICWAYNGIIDGIYTANDDFVKACGAALGNE